MPIKPEMKHLYGEEWTAIRERILDRDEHKCVACGVSDRSVGARDKDGEWHDEDIIHRMNSDVGSELFPEGFPKCIKIILTVAHLDHDATNNDESNLASLCQRCHLAHDAGQHAYNAMLTRLKKNRQSYMFDLLGINNYEEKHNDITSENRIDEKSIPCDTQRPDEG